MSTSLGMTSVSASERVCSVARLWAFWALIKPRIWMASLAAVLGGIWLAGGVATGNLLGLVGLACFVASGGVLNQLLEAGSDGRMRRTVTRPLVSGVVSKGECAAFGTGLVAAGVLASMQGGDYRTMWLGLFTAGLYTLVYTPLKKVTFAATYFGAVAGAMPPLLGWSLVGKPIELEILCVCGWLFCWQFPHFLAIARIYEQDYRNANLKMVPLGCFTGWPIGLMAAGYSCATLGASVLVWRIGLSGNAYCLLAVVGGLAYVVASIRFAVLGGEHSARDLMTVSLVYLLITMTALCADAAY